MAFDSEMLTRNSPSCAANLALNQIEKGEIITKATQKHSFELDPAVQNTHGEKAPFKGLQTLTDPHAIKHVFSFLI